MRAEVAASVVPHPRYFVVLWLHTDSDPPNADWQREVEPLIERRLSLGIPPERMRQLIISDGGAPNALQRQQFARRFHDGEPCKIVVLTRVLSNPVKRGVATAFRWLNPAIVFHRPSEAIESLAYLDLLDLRQTIRIEFQKLQLRLRPVRELAVVDAHLRPREALKAFVQTRLEVGEPVSGQAPRSPQEQVPGPQGRAGPGSRGPVAEWARAGRQFGLDVG